MLADSNVGCYIGNLCIAAVAYADDVALLAPTARAMRILLHICNEFALKFDVVFNAKKSKCLLMKPSARSHVLNERLPTVPFCIGGNEIEFVDSWPHLGHILNVNRDDGSDIGKTQDMLCGQINNVLCYFGHLYPVLKLKLLKIYCYSLYGSVLWDLDHSKLTSLCCTWRKGLRRTWDLPYRTHCNLLPVLCNCLPMYDELCRRTAAFINQCLNSDCDLVNRLTHYGIHVERMRSSLGRNAQLCCARYGVGSISQVDNSAVRKSFDATVSAELISEVSVLMELIFVRDGSFYFGGNAGPFCTRDELIAFISFICTN